MKRGCERFDNPESHDKARIAEEQIKQALKLVKANVGFFVYPFLCPAEFQAWVAQRGHRVAIIRFTEGLVDLGLVRFEEGSKKFIGPYVDALVGHEYSFVEESSSENKATQLKLDEPLINTVSNGQFRLFVKLLDKYLYKLPQLFIGDELGAVIQDFNSSFKEAAEDIAQKSDVTGKIDRSVNFILSSISYKYAALKKRGGNEKASIVKIVSRDFKNMIVDFRSHDVVFQAENFPIINEVFENYEAMLKLITDVTAAASEMHETAKNIIFADYLDAMTDHIWVSLEKYSHGNYQAQAEHADQFKEAIVRYQNLFELIKKNDPKALHMQKFMSYLSMISRKASDLENRGYVEEAATARKLIVSLNNELSIFCGKDMADKKNLEAFKGQCTIAINAARPILEQHRGLWKVILGNFLMFILTLGVLYLPVCTVKNAFGGNFFFFNTTRSGEILNNTESALSECIASQKSG